MTNTNANINRTREEIILLNSLGRIWLKFFYGIVRTSHIHDSMNDIFKDPLSRMLESESKMLAAEGKVEFRILDDQFFLNGLWIKPTITARDNLFLCADMFKNYGLGGISLLSTTTENQWRQFLNIFRTVEGTLEDRARNLNQMLAAAGNESITMHPILKIRDEREYDLPFPPAVLAAATSYAKTLVTLREFSQCDHGEEQITALRKIQRIVCDLIDLLEKAPRIFGLLSLLKNFDSYACHHGANVMVLSLMMGREIGLGRKELVDLGLAALLHDVGKIRISESVLNKQGKLTIDEWNEIQRHPTETAKIFLTLGYINLSVAERILVAFQHHWATHEKNAYPKPRRDIQSTFMSDIVAICVKYDALTTDKPYRENLEPWEALQYLMAESKEGCYRRDLLDIFFQVMGPLPVGSWAELPENKIGMVAVSGCYSPHPPFPVIYVPSDNLWIEKAVKLKPSKIGPKDWKNGVGIVFKNCEGSPLL